MLMKSRTRSGRTPRRSRSSTDNSSTWKTTFPISSRLAVKTTTSPWTILRSALTRTRTWSMSWLRWGMPNKLGSSLWINMIWIFKAWLKSKNISSLSLRESEAKSAKSGIKRTSKKRQVNLSGKLETKLKTSKREIREPCRGAKSLRDPCLDISPWESSKQRSRSLSTSLRKTTRQSCCRSCRSPP